MNVKALQRADRWFGVPLCWFLTVARAFFEGFSPPRAEKPNRLLFVKLAEQGSTVLAYAALRRAVEMVGRENVYFVAFEDNRFILDTFDIVPKENVLTVSTAGVPAFLWSMTAAIRRLRWLKCDAAVDLEFFSRGSAALAFLSGAKCRVGFHAFFGAGPYRGNLMTHRLLYNRHIHTTRTFLSLVDAVCRDATMLPTFDLVVPDAREELPMFQPLPDEVQQAKELLQRKTGTIPRLILLNPNAGDLLPLRRWPPERYVELARRLLEIYPEIFVAFTGSPAEAEVTAELARKAGSHRCICLAGETSLRQLLVLYTLSEVLVTNDSGPSHFAALTSIRVVTLFGPETPVLFAARTTRNRVLWAGLVCSPCVDAYNNRQSPCRNNVCMQAITVEQVLQTIRDLMP